MIKYFNFIDGKLAESINDSDTEFEILIDSLPELGAGEYFYAVLDYRKKNGDPEIVKVTGTNTTTATVERGSLNTVARAHNANITFGHGVLAEDITPPLNQYDQAFPAWGSVDGAWQSIPTWSDDGPSINEDYWYSQDPNGFAVPFDGIAPITPVHLASNGFTAVLLGTVLGGSDADLSAPILTLPTWARTTSEWSINECDAWRLRWGYIDDDDVWHIIRTDENVNGVVNVDGTVCFASPGEIQPPDDDLVTSLIVDFGVSGWLPWNEGVVTPPVGWSHRAATAVLNSESSVDPRYGTLILDGIESLEFDPNTTYHSGSYWWLVVKQDCVLLPDGVVDLLDINGELYADPYDLTAGTVVCLAFVGDMWRIIYDSSLPVSEQKVTVDFTVAPSPASLSLESIIATAGIDIPSAATPLEGTIQVDGGEVTNVLLPSSGDYDWEGNFEAAIAAFVADFNAILEPLGASADTQSGSIVTDAVGSSASLQFVGLSSSSITDNGNDENNPYPDITNLEEALEMLLNQFASVDDFVNDAITQAFDDYTPHASEVTVDPISHEVFDYGEVFSPDPTTADFTGADRTFFLELGSPIGGVGGGTIVLDSDFTDLQGVADYINTQVPLIDGVPFSPLATVVGDTVRLCDERDNHFVQITTIPGHDPLFAVGTYTTTVDTVDDLVADDVQEALEELADRVLLADTAVQPGDLGTAATADATDFATAAQGELADSAVQPGDLPDPQTAAEVPVDATGFSDNLSTSDDTVQKVADKVDSLSLFDGIVYLSDGGMYSGDTVNLPVNPATKIYGWGGGEPGTPTTKINMTASPASLSDPAFFVQIPSHTADRNVELRVAGSLQSVPRRYVTVPATGTADSSSSNIDPLIMIYPVEIGFSIYAWAGKCVAPIGESLATAISAHIAATDPHGDRSYADSLFAANDAMLFKGGVDCSANPNYPAASAGHTYIVTVAGKIGGASGIDVVATDLLICRVDGTSAGNQATVGSSWTVVQTNATGSVVSISTSVVDGHGVVFNGTTGAIVRTLGAAPATSATSLSVFAAPTGDLPIGHKLTSVTAGTASTDGVNVSQLMRGLSKAMVQPAVGEWWPTPFATIYAGATTLSRVYYMPIWIPTGVTMIDGFAVEVTTTTTSAVGRMGLYAPHATTLKPDALIIDAGTVDLSATGGAAGVRTLACTATAVTPDSLYYVAYCAQGATTAVRQIATGAFLKSFSIPSSTASNVFVRTETVCWGESSVTGGLPSTATPARFAAVDGQPILALKRNT
jgi:hypothetical protein